MKTNMTKRNPSLVLTLSLALTLALPMQSTAKDTQAIVTDFGKGELAIRDEAVHQDLDAQTQVDLEIEGLIKQIQRYAPSQMAKERIQWLLLHPYLDRDQILQRQRAIQAIAADDTLFAALGELFEVPQRRGAAAFFANMMKSPEMVGNQQLATNLQNVQMLGFTPTQLGMMGLVGYMQFQTVKYALDVVNHPVSALANVAFTTLVVTANSLVAHGHMPTLTATQRALQLKKIEESGLLNGEQMPEALQEIKALCGENSSCASRMIAISKTHPSSSRATFIARSLGLAPFLTLPANIYGHLNPSDIVTVSAVMTELESYYALAKFFRENRAKLVWPELARPGEAILSIENGLHPYLWLNRGDVVPNSIGLNDQMIKSMILTGPNTGGKTTFQQMYLTMLAMAMAGLPVPAKSMAFSPAYIMTNFTTNTGRLAEGVSTFQAQAQRVTDIANFVINPERAYPVAIAMDEILNGTSGGEHRALERGTLATLHSKPGVLLSVATHERTLSRMEDELNALASDAKVANIHVTLEGHRIEPGVSTDYNATDVMRKVGAPEVLIQRALGYLAKDVPGAVPAAVAAPADACDAALKP